MQYKHNTAFSTRAWKQARNIYMPDHAIDPIILAR